MDGVVGNSVMIVSGWYLSGFAERCFPFLAGKVQSSFEYSRMEWDHEGTEWVAAAFDNILMHRTTS